MSRFELGMSVNYAKAWNVEDAVREFFQNAIDEEKENPENKMSFNYNENSQILTIGNKKSVLTPKTLLLGVSSKEGKSELIGEHGEGYKVATVVLVRNGVTVRIYNNEKGEIWTSRVVRSKRYDSEVVCFDIEKKFFNKKENLVIELEGITKEMYSRIVENILHLQNVGEFMQSSEGRILLEERYSGKIFVEGLYVCTNSNVEKGYDFNAGMLKLDRDRGLVDTFDLKYVIAQMYLGLEDNDYIINHINDKDLAFVSSKLQYCVRCRKDIISDGVYSAFLEEYGESAIPVVDSNSFNEYHELGYKPVLVSRQVYEAINLKKRDLFSSYSISDIDREFNEWIMRNSMWLSDSEIVKLRDLWKRKSK